MAPTIALPNAQLILARVQVVHSLIRMTSVALLVEELVSEENVLNHSLVK